MPSNCIAFQLGLLSFRQKVESPGLSKRRFCAFDLPKRRSACLGLSSFWRNDHSQMSWVINRSGACHRPSSFLGHRPRCPAPGLHLVPLRSPVAVHPSQQPAISSFLWRPQSADARVVVPRAPHLQKKSSGPVSPPPLPCGWGVPAVIFSVAISGAALPPRPPSPFPPHPARHSHLPLPR